MKLIYHKHFIKAYRKLPEKIKLHTKERLKLFEMEPFYVLLNNHELEGKYKGYRSININGDYRAIYVLFSDNVAHFVKLGTHSDLYE